MFEADSQNFASAPSVPRGLKQKTFFGQPPAGTIGGPLEEGGGPSQPPPLFRPPPSNTSLSTADMQATDSGHSPVPRGTGCARLLPPPPVTRQRRAGSEPSSAPVARTWAVSMACSSQSRGSRSAFTVSTGHRARRSHIPNRYFERPQGVAACLKEHSISRYERHCDPFGNTLTVWEQAVSGPGCAGYRAAPGHFHGLFCSNVLSKQ